MDPARDALRGTVPRVPRISWAHGVWSALIVLSVAVTQLSEGAYQRDLATHSDEAAHFVTAICLLDYCRTAPGSDPMAFAEAFYVHYPKVAFGHWPPAFFVLQAVWYSIVGVTASAGILLVGAVAVFAAFVLFGRLRLFFGTWIAGLSLAVYVSLPVVRSSSSVLMPDMLAGLLSMLAVLALCDGCVARTWRPWIAAAVWSALAILTKESALSLLLFAPAALIVLGGQTRRTAWPFWAAYGLLTLVLLSIYRLTGVLRLRGIPPMTGLTLLPERLGSVLTVVQLMPWLVFAIAGLGALRGTLMTAGADRMVATHIRGAALWLVVWLACQVIFRDVIEQRYFLPAVFPLIILFAAGLDRLRRLVPSGGIHTLPRWRAITIARVIPTTIAVACVASMPAASATFRSGYSDVAASLFASADGPVTLVSSDTPGEGAMIVECLMRDAARQRIVLRASKMLASSDWMGGNYRLITPSVPEIRDLLNAIPVQFIVLDLTGFFDEGTRPHHRLLEKTMLEEAAQFRLVGEFPLMLGNQRHDGAIQVYENLKARGRRPDVVRVPMLETLGRTLEWHVDEGHTVAARPEVPKHLAMNVGGSISRFASALTTWLHNPGRGSWRLRVYPTSDVVDAGGGPGAISVTAQTGDEWVARTAADWLTIRSGARGTGNGLVRYDIARNVSNDPRSGEIVIGDTRYLVRQSARE